jgi:hypothetical protein
MKWKLIPTAINIMNKLEKLAERRSEEYVVILGNWF